VITNYTMKHNLSSPLLSLPLPSRYLRIFPQAYLRFASIPFTCEECASTGASPTSALPALERGDDLIGPAAPPGAGDDAAAAHGLMDWRAARGILDHLKTVSVDLDSALSLAER
jgi:hypothetical protein